MVNISFLQNNGMINSNKSFKFIELKIHIFDEFGLLITELCGLTMNGLSSSAFSSSFLGRWNPILNLGLSSTELILNLGALLMTSSSFLISFSFCFCEFASWFTICFNDLFCCEISLFESSESCFLSSALSFLRVSIWISFCF